MDSPVKMDDIPMQPQNSSQADSIVVDPTLRSVLAAANRAQQECLQLLDLIEAHKRQDQARELEVLASKQQRILVSQMAVIRRQHRRAIMEMRATKQETAVAKQEVDGLHLQLQNVVYIQRHLRGEIDGCENYGHKYRSLPLISEEEYLVQHPEQASLGPHDFMIARIEHEHLVRQTLEEKRQGLLKKKQSLIQANNKRKENLASLDRELEKFIDAAGPIQQTFEKGLAPGA